MESEWVMLRSVCSVGLIQWLRPAGIISHLGAAYRGAGNIGSLPANAGIANGKLRMHIVAIGWLYVTLMMAITEKNITAGLLTFVFYGLAPCALVFWLAGTALRHRAAKRKSSIARAMSDEQVDKPDGADTRPDQ